MVSTDDGVRPYRGRAGDVMTYLMGIDLGTTFSTVAVSTATGVEVLSLGTRSSAVPSVVFVPADGDPVIGEAEHLVHCRELVLPVARWMGDDERIRSRPHPLHGSVVELA
jgi:molecular chaperone DnaK (HSP70)